ncbi:F-box protein At3g07870-like [Silene latifolia]|uniref:F-box protein At3g07870-like n=1 Tax=Silene latifolia TaxID=37657 RepID=UPI003D788DEE
MLKDILMELVSRLPYKSIMRRLYNQSNKYNFFLHTARASMRASLIEYLPNDHEIVLAKHFNLMDFVHKHEISISDFSIVTSCNDMLLCRVIHNHDDCSTTESLRLMNLVTGTYLTVGQDPLVEQGSSIRYAFGYSPSATRYKVLRFDIDKVIRRLSTVKILTVNSRADDCNWRPIDTDKSDVYNEISEQIRFLVNPVVLNNSIHWIISSTNKIVRFDLDKEEFELVPKPYDEDLTIGQLSVVGGSLSILASHEKGRSDRVEAWVMKRYGVQESWTRLAVVNDFNIDAPLKLIRVLDNGKFLFQSNNGLSLYDPNDEKWDEKVIQVPMNNPVISSFSRSK